MEAQARLDDRHYEKVADKVLDFMRLENGTGHRFALRYLNSMLNHPSLIGWNPEYNKCCELGFAVVSDDGRLTVTRCPIHGKCE